MPKIVQQKAAPQPAPQPVQAPVKPQTPSQAAPTVKEPVQSPTPPSQPAPSETPEQSRVQADDFAPMPKAKSADGNDLMGLWASLLANIQKPPVHALLKQWARPVKITPEEVVITVKNEIYLNQFVSGSKRDTLQKAVDTLFSASGVVINVRLPLPEDEAIIQKAAAEKKSDAAPVKPSPEPISTQQPKEETPSLKEVEEDIEAAENSDTGEETATELNSAKSKRFEDMHSDTVNMVMDLFDGKVIE